MECLRANDGNGTPQEVIDIANDLNLIGEFLRKNRQLLVTNIWPVLHAFFSWMRSKSVFTLCDQQLTEIPSEIPINKAGKFLDIVATKGRDGFVAFAEVLEYQCPHIFKHIFQLTPRIPPAEFRGSVRNSFVGRRSANSVGLLLQSLDTRLEMFSHITADFFENARQTQADDERESRELNDIIQRLQEENAKLQFEMQIMETDRDRQNENAEVETTRINKLTEQLEILKGENARLAANRRKSTEKDVLTDEQSMLTVENPSAGPPSPTRTCEMCSSAQRILSTQTCQLTAAKEENIRLQELYKTECRDKQYYMDRCIQLETAQETCVHSRQQLRKNITPLQRKKLPLEVTALPAIPIDGGSLTSVTLNIDTFPEDIKLIGGNYSGIFVRSCSAKARHAGLREGDQLIKIEQNSTANENLRSWSLENRTKEHVISMTDKISGEITIHKQGNEDRYQLLREAIENDRIGEDCFCIAITEPVTPETGSGLVLVRGDVVVVTDTCSQHGGSGDTSKGVWYGIRLDSRTGALLDRGIVNCNFRFYAARTEMHEESSLKRWRAFKKKYCQVLPYEAHYERPLVLFGLRGELDDIRRSLCASESFIVCDLADVTIDRHLESISEEVALHCFTSSSHHIILKASLKQTTDLMAVDLHPIIVLLKFANGDIDEELREVQKKLMRYQYDELVVEQNEPISDTCRRLMELYTQDRMIWLNCAALTSPL